MGTVIILLEDKFEDMEAMYPYYRMKEAGHRVEVVGPQTIVYHGKYGYPLKAEKTPADSMIDDMAAVIIPGGHAPDRMRMHEGMVRLVKEAVERGAVIAAICHGPQMLIEADVLRGKRATCYKAVKTDLTNAGALYEDAPVVVDGNMVTSRIPADLPEFCRAILKLVS